MRLIFGQDQLLAEWTRRRIKQMEGTTGFGPCVTIGIANAQNDILGCVVFHNWDEKHRHIEWSAAAKTANWLSPRLISAIMEYPFGQLGCVRISARIPKKNRRSCEFQERFGFKREGLVRRGFGGDDMVIFGLLRSDWAKSPFNVANRHSVVQKPEEARVH